MIDCNKIDKFSSNPLYIGKKCVIIYAVRKGFPMEGQLNFIYKTEDFSNGKRKSCD